VYGVAPGQAAPRAHAPRTPTPPRANTGPGGEHVQELQQMLNEMRRQMDEMREQMQSLRQELERAPQREMR
jgi:predicted RNase H-like nuclease (RuvC/YqgF family)